MIKAAFVFFVLIFITSCSHSRQENAEIKAATLKPRAEKEEDLISEKITNPALMEMYPAKAKADSLVRFYRLATSGQTGQKYERLFFEAFPSTFLEMQQLFGYDEIKGSAPLYESTELINFFANLTSIPKAEYYRKYTGICINGVWQADNIADGFGFAYKLLLDTKASCSSLETRTDEEIRSIFRFIFDGPHPDNKENKELYKKLLPKIATQSKRPGKLLTESYETLIKESDDHGH